MLSVNNFKPGVSFIDQNEIFVVLDAQHSKQARGQASVKAKVKNLKTGAIVLKTYTGGEKLKEAYIEKVKMSFIYADDADFYFMNNETYEQVAIAVEKLTWEKNFLYEGLIVNMKMFEDQVLDVDLPVNIELTVASSPAAVKGNTQTKPTKKALLNTGFSVDIPMFISEGEKIIVSTETGKYVSRSKK